MGVGRGGRVNGGERVGSMPIRGEDEGGGWGVGEGIEEELKTGKAVRG